MLFIEVSNVFFIIGLGVDDGDSGNYFGLCGEAEAVCLLENLAIFTDTLLLESGKN